MSPSSVIVFTLLITIIRRIESFQSSDNEYDPDSFPQQQSYYHTFEWRLNQLRRLGTNVCRRFEGYRNEYIIDIKSSVRHGAQLVNADKAEDVVSCASLCCNNAICDLSLFRMNGESNAGHNCYLVKCGNPASCKLAYHKDFVSVIFKPTIENDPIGMGREHSPVDHDPVPAVRPHVTTSIDLSSSLSPIAVDSTKAESHNAYMSDDVMMHTTNAIPVQSNSPIATDEDQTKHNKENPENENHVDNDHQVEDENQAESGNQAENIDNAVQIGRISVNTSLVPATTVPIVAAQLSIVHHHDNTHSPTKDPCDVDGCGGGSGLIVVGVVGLVAFLVVFFVGVVVTRRLYLNKQKKHYHNVDYLINGMYT